MDAATGASPRRRLCHLCVGNPIRRLCLRSQPLVYLIEIAKVITRQSPLDSGFVAKMFYRITFRRYSGVSAIPPPNQEFDGGLSAARTLHLLFCNAGPRARRPTQVLFLSDAPRLGKRRHIPSHSDGCGRLHAYLGVESAQAQAVSKLRPIECSDSGERHDSA